MKTPLCRSLILVCLLAICGWNALSAETNTFCVFAIPAKKQVRPNETFKLDVCIRNPTATNQFVHTWTCAWPLQWTSSNKRVQWKFDGCDSNFPDSALVLPGTTLTNTLEAFILNPIPGETVSWKTGFQQDTKSAQGEISLFHFDPPIWGDELKVEVIR